MLKYLHIENIAVIEKADIELNSGLNVMTGETGAGKSIVIDAINAVLGERTSRELIRGGCEKAQVTALFGDLNDTALEVLSKNGFSVDEDGNLLIKRSLNLSGNNSVRINGVPATVGILKEIGAVLVNIHGQHDNQFLLDPAKHCGYIDRVAENDLILKEYYDEFKNLNSIRRQLSQLETDSDEKQHRIELLTYQIDEIEKAGIRVGEYAELKQQLLIAENYEKMLSSLNSAYLALSGDDENDGACSLVNKAQKNLQSLNDDSFSSTAINLEEISVGLEEVVGNIRDFLKNSEYSNLDANEIRERLDFLYRLMLKYGDSEEKLLEFFDNAKAELENITFSDKRIAELSVMLDDSTERLVAHAEKLTASRKEAAVNFEKQVSEALRFLDMPNVRFVVDFKSGRYTKNGCDDIQFLISANAGEEPKPLIKIASGGELSRVMLAIKSVLADKDEVATLIFDEIDTGISGRAAAKVGAKLRKVSKNRQVLCVTHLAQIAACADTHLLIEKHINDNRTFTDVSSLSDEQIIGEIARIMSGGELTDNLYGSAKELLDRSKK
ncbi:MAG: DNA repair protein RecN [Ruminococcaceae bacterium]|nr:DNA repair protein RecN [Oscillospiraceae bacterium]